MATSLENPIIGVKASLELPFHEHALILRDLSRNCSLCCQACALEIHGGQTYCCEDCHFFFHKSCAESPSKIRHPSHPQHQLRLHCSGDFSGRFVYRCEECGFIVSAASAIATLGDVEDDEETIEHFAHDEHRLSYFSVTTPNRIECKACGESISGKVYGCRACIFLLHESCARLPMRIDQHVLHSQHRLNLFARSGNLFECRACGFVRYDEFAYRCECDECKFNLDVECAISTLSLQKKEGANTIQHFPHQQHPLVSFQMEKESRNICCQISGKNLSGEVYGCVDCIFFLLKSSAELPQKLQHFLHPRHTLNLSMVSSGFVFRCEPCNFDLDPESALQTLSAVENGAEDKIKHFAHDYPMTLQFVNKGLDGSSCGACKKKTFGLAYRCLIPGHDFVLHKSCAELQLQLKHPSHPQHPLVLLPAAINGFFNCSACNRESKGFTFYCSECEFHLDIECSLQQPTRKHHLHEHKLTYYKKTERLRCDRCDNSCNTDLYRCVPCNFNLHHDCLPLPQYAKTDKHWDILELRDEFITDDSNGYIYCDECDELRHPKHGVYLCEKGCEFAAHITCMYSQVLAKIPEVIKEPKKYDEPDEETMKIDCNSSGEDIATLMAKIEEMKIKLEVLKRDRANMKLSFIGVHDQQEYDKEGQTYKTPEVKPLNGSDKIFSNLARIEDESDDEDKSVGMYSAASAQTADSTREETTPFLGGESVLADQVIRGNKTASTYDLVEQMHFLYVRVVKARELPAMDLTGNIKPFVEVKVGKYRGITKYCEKKQNPGWNQVFAFSRMRIQASGFEVVVKDKHLVKDNFVGILRFDINEVPLRVPPDSALAPEWYRLEDKKGDKIKGELMVAVWIGTQADEAFPDAWYGEVNSKSAASTLKRSKVYHTPRMWYLRVSVLQAQELVPAKKNQFPEFQVKGQLGHQIMKTRTVQARTLHPQWNEDLVFVAAEPFEDHLILTVEDRVTPGKVIGMSVFPLHKVEKRTDNLRVQTQWLNLERPVAFDVDQLKKDRFSMKMHLRVSLDGGYHVLDESTHYISDLRPTAEQLWKPSIGLLELGILKAVGLQPMKNQDGKGTSDTYCVAKYGHKWVRTRTIVDSLSPKFNEQYTWEVFDPATVLTIGVFDNRQIGEKGNKDLVIGKVRIRISTLQTGRVNTNLYPLVVLHPAGVKKMGELHLAIRFSCTSFANMLYTYLRPLLPEMHYLQPINAVQLEMLRPHAVALIAARLGREEPPLRREVVEYMTDADSHLWSMRQSKANFFRLISVLSSGLAEVRMWFRNISMWKNPITTVIVHVIYLMLVCFPKLILYVPIFYVFFVGIWNFLYRPRHPSVMDTMTSPAEAVHPDELDEELEKLKTVIAPMQTVAGNVAAHGERFQNLLSWRDPRATTIFITFCLVVWLVIYVTPFQVIAALAGFYMMRHPRFHHRLPSSSINFFRRLPTRIDGLL